MKDSHETYGWGETEEDEEQDAYELTCAGRFSPLTDSDIEQMAQFYGVK